VNDGSSRGGERLPDSIVLLPFSLFWQPLFSSACGARSPAGLVRRPPVVGMYGLLWPGRAIQDGPCWILGEAPPEEAIARRLAELGRSCVVFDPCGKLPEEGDYLDVMRGNGRCGGDAIGKGEELSQLVKCSRGATHRRQRWLSAPWQRPPLAWERIGYPKECMVCRVLPELPQGS
jgi:hypothetical protein